jgi:hypothetical protein
VFFAAASLVAGELASPADAWLSPRVEAALAEEAARVARLAPQPRGRVLADEIPVVTTVDMMNVRR